MVFFAIPKNERKLNFRGVPESAQQRRIAVVGNAFSNWWQRSYIETGDAGDYDIRFAGVAYEGIDDPVAAKAQSRQWYLSSPAADDALRARFGATLALAEKDDLPTWLDTDRGQLALVILLDQLSRNLYRGTARAFSNDPRALALAEGMIDRGADRLMAPIERAFLYHPFEHAESRAAQQRSVALFTDLVAGADSAWRPQLQDFLHHAQAHRDIVETYGRFPHRNQVLGRTDTAAERDYLATAQRFGQ